MTEKNHDKDSERSWNQEQDRSKKDSTKEPTNPSWKHIHSDLKGALDTWADLSEKLADEISPEEKQLQEMKALLVSLKDKIKEFSEK